MKHEVVIDKVVQPKAAVILIFNGSVMLGRVFLHRTQLFQVFGAYPVPWDVNNKTMSFLHIKTAFVTRAQEIKF